MPIKIEKKVTYNVEVKCPTLGIEVAKEIDEAGLRKAYAEIDQLCTELADALGAIRLPHYKTPTPTHAPQSESGQRLLEYAKTVADFTIKGASDALCIPYQTLYTAAAKLEQEHWLTKAQSAGSIPDIYKYREPPLKKEQIPAIVVLPDGKVPFPDRLPNPEAEKINGRNDRY